MTAVTVTRPDRLVALCRLAWREARPAVQLIFLLRFLAGAGLGWVESAAVLGTSLVPAAAGWLAGTWAVYLLNGVADTVEDRANGSVRPIARRALPERAAVAGVWLLAAAALGLGALVSATHVLLTALLLAVGWGYSMGPRPFKTYQTGFVLSVVTLGALTYLAGWCAVGGAGPSASLLTFGLAMSCWMGFGGSTKDLSDTSGDRLAGRRTLPVMLGERRARVVMALAAGAVGWTFLGWCVVRSSRLLPASVVLCLGSVVLAVVALTRLGHGDRDKVRRPYRAYMGTQYLAHLTLFVLLPGG